jgi:uncharacterized phage protein gp47/JayE
MIVIKSASRVDSDLRHYFSSIQKRITDFNIGSVIRDFFYSIATSIGSIYLIISNVYNAMFVSTAAGDDLDKLGTNYTLLRRTSSQAEGEVTFYRTSPPTSDIIIPQSTIVRTISTNTIQSVEFQTVSDVVLVKEVTAEQITYYRTYSEYNLGSRKVFEIKEVTGTYSGNEGYTFEPEIDYVLDTSDESQAVIEWKNKKPDDLSIFYVTYVPMSVDAQITAVVPGQSGNVIIGAITVMTARIAGIEFVSNYTSTAGGSDAESDIDFRNRITMFLSSLSKGVENSIMSAALSVPGVVNCKVVQPNPPNGFLTIYIDDGSGTATTTMIRNVKDKIDGTINGVSNSSVDSFRAIGVGVNVIAPSIKEIFVNFQVLASVGYETDTLQAEIIQALSQYLMGLASGMPVIRADVVRVVMQIEGVENLILDNSTINGLFTDINVEEFEVARLKQAIVSVT